MFLNFILQALFQSTQHLYEKKEGSPALLSSVRNKINTEKKQKNWRSVPPHLRLLMPCNTFTIAGVSFADP
jgi:hypothetical protein